MASAHAPPADITEVMPEVIESQATHTTLTDNKQTPGLSASDVEIKSSQQDHTVIDRPLVVNESANTTEKPTTTTTRIATSVNIQSTSMVKRQSKSLTNQSVRNQSNSKAKSVTYEARRESSRVKNAQTKTRLTTQLVEAIELQRQINGALAKELQTKVQYERLADIKADLAASLKHIQSLHNELKQGDTNPDKNLVTRIDRLTHDNQHITKQVEQIMSDMSVRERNTLRQNRALSVQSGHVLSQKSSYYSSSVSSKRSSNSALLRMKASEAAAVIAEKEVQLETDQKVQQVEQELLELNRQKRSRVKELQIQGEIEAERRKMEVFERALAEEEMMEDTGFLLPPDSEERRISPQEKDRDQTRPAVLRNTFDRVPRETSFPLSKNSANDVVNLIADKELDQDSEAGVARLPPQLADAEVKRSQPTEPLTTANELYSPSTCSQADGLGQSASVLADAISSALNMSRLPPPEPFIFSGDPLQYTDWVVAFESLIGSRRCSVVEKLYYLKRYVSGKAKEVVNGYFLLQSEDAYQKAKSALQKRFGDSYTVSEAFRTKIERWPQISTRDGEGLRSFADFLQQCQTAMSSVPDLKILEDNRENKKMLQKVPDWVVRKWVRQVATWKEKHGSFPTFALFCKFLSKEADIACSTLLNDHTPTPEGKRPEKRNRVSLKTEHNEFGNGSSYENNRTGSQDQKTCVYCNMANHATAVCGKVSRLPFGDIHNFMKTKKLCFSCLKPEQHGYKACPKPEICNVCTGSHPTSLHALRSTPRNVEQDKYNSERKTQYVKKQPQNDSNTATEQLVAQPKDSSSVETS